MANIKIPIYLKLEVVYNNFFTDKITNVTKYVLSKDRQQLQVFTFHQRLKCVIFVDRHEVINVFVLGQHNKKVKIF